MVREHCYLSETGHLSHLSTSFCSPMTVKKPCLTLVPAPVTEHIMPLFGALLYSRLQLPSE